MIIKHGVKNSLHQKESLLFMDTLTSYEPDKLTEEKRKHLEKEVAEEKATLERITKLTDGFKDYISGKKRGYEVDPYWIK
jgi:cell division protein FtsB